MLISNLAPTCSLLNSRMKLFLKILTGMVYFLQCTTYSSVNEKRGLRSLLKRSWQSIKGLEQLVWSEIQKINMSKIIKVLEGDISLDESKTLAHYGWNYDPSSDQVKSPADYLLISKALN